MSAKLPPHKYVDFTMKFISGVTRPAQAPAQALFVAKRHDTQENQMDPKDKEIADLKTTLFAAAKRHDQVMALTGPQFDLFRTMSAKRQDEFLEMSGVVRDTEVTKALEADPVVGTLPDGTVVRKSSGAIAVSAVKAIAAMQASLASAQLVGQVAVMKTRVTTECGNYPLTEAQAIEALTALEAIKNDETRTAVVKAWGAGNTALDEGTPRGRTHGDVRVGKGMTDGDPEQVYIANVRKHAEDQKISVLSAYSAYQRTEKGAKEFKESEAYKKGRDKSIEDGDDD